ncbi:MAG: hypothetical protein QXK37_02210 [Candidatus Woesearchaeota archaeon]
MKAQLKMAESIIVLIVFFFLLVFGLIFYAKIEKGLAREKETEDFEIQAVQISQKAQALPEIQCTRDSIVSFDCIDLLKIKALSNVSSSNSEMYKKMFPNTRITLVSAYPYKDSWLVYDGTWSDEGVINFTIPVSLYNPITKQYSFGIMGVEVYR